MGFDLPVFISAGVQDALTPMQLAVVGIYGLMMFFLRHSRKMVLFTAGGLFIGIVVVLGMLFSLGFFDLGVMAPGFGTALSWGFLVLGVVFLVLGFMFFREWRLLLSGLPRKFAPFIPTPLVGMVAGLALSFFLAVGAGFFSGIWPVNYQVLAQGEMAFTPGRFFYSLGAFCIYVLFRSGVSFFFILLFILAQREKNAAFLRRKRSLVSVIVSAFYFAAGGSLIFFFYVAATKQWL